MPTTTLQAALQNLPADAKEPVVESLFVEPYLMEALGFFQGEVYPKYPTGSGRIADYAARKNENTNDIFLQTQRYPNLLIEVKGRNVNLSPGSSEYIKTVKQIEGYLLDSKCNSSSWGLIFNANHIQLFRKHGKVIFPATSCLEISLDNIDNIINDIKAQIINPKRALTVAIYNNKGGVGKTTTTVNLAAVLHRAAHKKVLTIDLDPHQQDLTKSLDLALCDGEFYNFLVERDFDLLSCIKNYSIVYKKKNVDFFDVIPVDKVFLEQDESKLRQHFRLDILRKRLEVIKCQYDYILIDAPPNWRLFSQMAVCAADVVLIPTTHNNIFSIENASIAIKQFIPEIQKLRDDGGPVPLPIFFNGEKINSSRLIAAHNAIDEILKQSKSDFPNLINYFYPKFTRATKNRDIFNVPGYANIANAAFARIPAAYRDRTANSYYTELAKEYFLQ